jgi:hypothetical protein
MKQVAVLLVVILSACNLVTDDELRRRETQLTTVPTTEIPVEIEDVATASGSPTLLPLPGILPTGITPIRGGTQTAASTPLPGGLCEVYATYSGSDPDNKLSMRAEPSADAAQVFRVPNFAPVYRVAGSSEVEAEGYHWLNVIYLEGGTRYVGWIARDSFQTNGVRDPSISTLRITGQPMPCP